jgi:hypothetical protein
MDHNTGCNQGQCNSLDGQYVLVQTDIDECSWTYTFPSPGSNSQCDVESLNLGIQWVSGTTYRIELTLLFDLGAELAGTRWRTDVTGPLDCLDLDATSIPFHSADANVPCDTALAATIDDSSL